MRNHRAAAAKSLSKAAGWSLGCTDDEHGRTPRWRPRKNARSHFSLLKLKDILTLSCFFPSYHPSGVAMDDGCGFPQQPARGMPAMASRVATKSPLTRMRSEHM